MMHGLSGPDAIACVGRYQKKAAFLGVLVILAATSTVESLVLEYRPNLYGSTKDHGRLLMNIIDVNHM